MPGLIHEHAYEASKKALCAQHPRVGDALDAIEWALTRDDDCDRDFYPLILSGARGNVRCFASDRISRPGGVWTEASTVGAVVESALHDVPVAASCLTRKKQCERVTVDAVIVVQPIDAR